MSKLVATFAGDSGDGVQFLGNAFSDFIAQLSFEHNTLPDFPAEIRAPAGKMFGVSGFQIQWGDEPILTAGNLCDILVAFNAAGYKKYQSKLKTNGLLIYDPSGFDAKNCKLADFHIAELETIRANTLAVPFSSLTLNALHDFDLSDRDKDKNKNIFALGYLVFGMGGDIDLAKNLVKTKFSSDASQTSVMIHVLMKGYHFAETTEFFFQKISVGKKVLKKGIYKNVTGNAAIALALLAAPKIFGKHLFFGGYPITPASDILHELSKHKFKEIIARQAEDEMAAAAMALGASYGGAIGVTASSGPGIDLKQEVIGLAHSAELPLLIIDVQRAGPSTGMPTKVEQSDLDLALYGRHGESPVPVIAVASPSNCYQSILDAIEVMIVFQTPVILLSDASIANGSELWMIPSLSEIKIDCSDQTNAQRNENLVRPWVLPGTEDRMFVVGGLERDYQNGTISYDGPNHQKMTSVRREKIEHISAYIAPLQLEEDIDSDILIISWGSTRGAVRESIQWIQENQKKSIAHIHLQWIFPLPSNFSEQISRYEKIIVPELNNGQLANYLNQFTSTPIYKINKIQGLPFYCEEITKELMAFI